MAAAGTARVERRSRLEIKEGINSKVTVRNSNNLWDIIWVK